MMENLLPWFALKDVPGIGNLLFKRLIDRFKSPEGVLSASPDDLLRVNGMHRRLIEAIRRHKPSERIKQEIDRALEKGYSILKLFMPNGLKWDAGPLKGFLEGFPLFFDSVQDHKI